MSSSSPLLRIVWAVLALVQLTVTVGAPLADAALEDGAKRVVHVESESGEDCPSQHDHLFCQLCRTMVFAEAEARPARLHGPPPAPATGVGISPATDLPPPPSGQLSPLGSRAPPFG